MFETYTVRSEMNPKRSRIIGTSISVSSVLFLAFIVYTNLFAQFMPVTGVRFIDFWRDDWYYCCMIPAAIPTIVAFSYWAWASSQFFRYS